MLDAYPESALKKLESQYTYHSDDIYYYNAHRPAYLVHKLKNRISEFDSSLVEAIIQKETGKKIVEKQVSQYFGTGHVIVFVKTRDGLNLVLRATHALDEPEKYIDIEKDIIRPVVN